MRVLLAYASEHGTTQTVAERIARRLRDSGLVTVVQDVDQGPTCESYDAVVLGSAVQGSQWLPQAIQFANRNEAWLSQKPVWLFSVGLHPAAGWQRGPFARMIAAAPPAFPLQFTQTHRVVEHRAFSGALRREATRFGEDVLLRLLGARFGDFRNWEAIDHWADGIAACLLSPGAHGAGQPDDGPSGSEHAAKP